MTIFSKIWGEWPLWLPPWLRLWLAVHLVLGAVLGAPISVRFAESQWYFGILGKEIRLKSV